MATDSSELTFIRCPSCRSLVPAISTRCRMCGATLNTAASPNKDATNADTRPSSRIRQRTVSMPSSATEDLVVEPSPFTPPPTFSEPAPVVAKQAETESVRVDPPEAAPIVEAAPEIDPRDPLGAFLEEVPVETPEAAPEPVVAEVAAPVAAEIPAAVVASPSPIIPATVAPVAITPSPAPLSMDDDEDLPDTFTPVKKDEGAKKNGFHPVAELSPIKKETFMEHAMQEQPTPTQKEPVRNFKEVESVMETPVDTSIRDAMTSKPVEKKAKEEVAIGEGKLVGWLVSYDSANGKATELREGKFFVSKTSLKTNDLLLNDASVSTPHALMKAVAGEGLLVQDLMSDRGVFFRKKSAGGYQKSVETIKLEHGDWVRFGDVEFLVCLIAS